MGSRLPELGREEFSLRLRRSVPGAEISSRCVASLFEHYQELCRWNPRLSLVGPGTAASLVERHYAESLQALPLIPRGRRTLVDLGSGGGFPGWILAAARPDLDVYLIEARQRKWAFLEAAASRAALSVTCLNARDGPALPAGLPSRIDVLTVRAVRLDEGVVVPLLGRLADDARVLLWAGEESPALAGDLEVVGAHPLEGSRHRRILEVRPNALRTDRP